MTVTGINALKTLPDLIYVFNIWLNDIVNMWMLSEVVFISAAGGETCWIWAGFQADNRQFMYLRLIFLEGAIINITCNILFQNCKMTRTRYFKQSVTYRPNFQWTSDPVPPSHKGPPDQVHFSSFKLDNLSISTGDFVLVRNSDAIDFSEVMLKFIDVWWYSWMIQFRLIRMWQE